MFYTLTMNPAIDLFIETNRYEPNVVNRTEFDDIQPNGKGVNVSFVLRKLGIKNVAIGFSGGFTGRYIEDALIKEGIGTKFINVTGTTRINVFTRVSETNQEYKLVNKGPKVGEESQKLLLDYLSTLTEKDTLVISGSLPLGVDSDYLLKIQEHVRKNNVRVIIDTSDKVVLECLKYKPYLIKPNNEELQFWFDKENQILDHRDFVELGKKLISMGAEQILLSLGAEGCMYINADTVLYANAPKGKVVNTACSGDTLLGVFLAKRNQGISLEESLAYAVASGSSTAFREGITDFSDVEDLLMQVEVTNFKED